MGGPFFPAERSHPEAVDEYDGGFGGSVSGAVLFVLWCGG